MVDYLKLKEDSPPKIMEREEKTLKKDHPTATKTANKKRKSSSRKSRLVTKDQAKTAEKEEGVPDLGEEVRSVKVKKRSKSTDKSFTIEV